MSGSHWGRHSKSCCNTPLASMSVSYAWQISRGPATSSTTGVWHVLCHTYEEQKKWWENVIFNIRVLSRLTEVLTWAASLGWTSAVTYCYIYREYHVPVGFEFWYPRIRTSTLLASSLEQSFRWNATKFNWRIMWMTVIGNFCCFSV